MKNEKSIVKKTIVSLITVLCLVGIYTVYTDYVEKLNKIEKLEITNKQLKETNLDLIDTNEVLTSEINKALKHNEKLNVKLKDYNKTIEELIKRQDNTINKYNNIEKKVK